MVQYDGVEWGVLARRGILSEYGVTRPALSVETITTDHSCGWIQVAESDPEGGLGSETTRAWVFDLASCAGRPLSGRFVDDDRSVFERDIEWLADERITSGCDPSHGSTRFCPDDPITRGQMAAFLVRALDLGAAPPSPFTDLDTSVFRDDIDRLAHSGITRGCTPTEFCVAEEVSRGQLGAFLHRALG